MLKYANVSDLNADQIQLIEKTNGAFLLNAMEMEHIGLREYTG